MTTDDRLGLAFVIRSPGPTLVVRPSWWTSSFDGKWLIEAYDHDTKEMFLGSGATREAMMDDLEQGLDPKRAHDLGSVDLRKP